MAIEDLVIQGEFEITRVYAPDKSYVDVTGFNSDHSKRVRRKITNPEGRSWMYQTHLGTINQLGFRCSEDRLNDGVQALD